MVISGRLDASDTDQSSDEVICSMPTEGVLSSEHLEVLSHEYKKSVPMYVQILKEYEKAAKRAANSRSMSLFPGNESWNPVGRSLSSKEREMLVGPLRSVTYFSKLTVRDKITNRLIEYSCTNLSLFPDHIPKQTSSFVSLLFHDSAQPQFGCIVALFSHAFLQESCYWAEVEQFTLSEYDSEVNMWHVSVDQSKGNFCHSSIVKLHQLSYPLVVAFDCNNLWFLNF